MKPYTKTYLKEMGYTVADFIPCEVCGAQAVDTHHIERRGMGGNKKVYKIEELMGLCRSCHIEYGDKRQHLEFLKDKHRKAMRARGVNK